MGFTAAVLGASGYAGGELVRLLDGHPSFQVAYLGAHSSAGKPLGSVHPHLPGGERLLGPIAADGAADCDVVFLALPHGESAGIAAELARSGKHVVDLGADFRLGTAQQWRDAYGTDHPVPEELGAWAYGIPELFGEQVAGARKTAVPGCYPTSAVLALAPLLKAGLVDATGIVVDSISGVTRRPSSRTSVQGASRSPGRRDPPGRSSSARFSGASTAASSRWMCSTTRASTRSAFRTTTTSPSARPSQPS